MKIKDLQKGTYFTRKPIEYPKENQVWVRGGYDRASRRYRTYKWEDINTEMFMRGDTEVYIDFIF